MKTLKFSLLCAGAVLLFCFTGCSIDDSINKSPNDVRDDQLASRDGVYGLLIGMQTMTGDFYSSDHSRIASMWSLQVTSGQGAGRAQPIQWANYTLDPLGPPNDMWLYAYKAIHECDDILRLAPKVVFDNDSLKNVNLKSTILGIANVHKALIYGELAAMYGSIPVNLMRIEDPAYTPPQFASQADAYKQVQTLLDDALTQIQTVTLSRDLNFKGNGPKWIALIHSLKARYYLHVSDYTNALTEAKLGIADASGSLVAFYSDNALEYSPWGHWVIDEDKSIVAAKAFVDSLKSEPGDLRLAQYFEPNDSGKIVGYSATSADPQESDFSLASKVKKYGAYADAFPMATFQENVLIRAEAAARTGDIPSAVADINIIRKSAGLTDFSSSDGNAIVTQILKQKWLELFLEGQSYHDMRRTKTLPDPQPGKNIRIIYPATERNANPNTPGDNDALVKPLSAY